MSTRSLSRRYLPSGLFGRSLLIIVMPMVLLQAAVSYLLFDRQWESVTMRMARGVSAQIGMVMATYKSVGPEKFAKELPALTDASFGMRATVLPNTRIPETESDAYDVLQQVFVRELSIRVGRPVWIDAFSLDDDVDIRVQLDTSVVRFLVERKRVMSTNTHIWMLWITGGGVSKPLACGPSVMRPAIVPYSLPAIATLLRRWLDGGSHVGRWLAAVAIISMAQQARPKSSGHMEAERLQL